MTTKEKRDLVWIDTETTGFDPEHDEIVEIAIVRIGFEALHKVQYVIDVLNSAKTYHQYFLPNNDPSEEVCAINGYSREVWKQNGAGPVGVEALAQIGELLVDGTIAGQNPQFDIQFLKKAFSNARDTISWPKTDYHVLDVASLAWPLYVAGNIKGVGLIHTRKFFGLTGKPHRAMNDVLDVISVYRHLTRSFMSVIG